MNKKVLPIILVVYLVLSLVFSLTGCSMNPFEKGVEIQQKVSIDKDSIIGSLEKTGWQLEIPEGAFKNDIQLTMKVFSSDDMMNLEKGDFEIIGSPVELGIAENKNIRLNEPIQIKLQIPKELLKEDMAIDELFYGYYYDGGWEYYIPESVDIKNGVVSLNTYHFSILGIGNPSKEEQIEAYAKAIAMKKWHNQEKKKEFTNATSGYFDELFKSMGVKSKAARNQLAADVISYLEHSYIESSGVSPLDALAQTANSASKGEAGKQEFQNKLLEFTGKALIRVMERDPSAFSKSVNIIGNLSSAAGSLLEGDEKAALQSVANMLKGAVPLAALADATSNYLKEKINDSIDYWTEEELRKAYEVYATGIGGKWGYEDGLKGDFETIFTLLGGGDRQVDIKIIKQYCEKRGIDEGDLTEEERRQILNNAKKALKESFDKRIVAEAEMAAVNTEKDAFVTAEKTFISKLKDQGLLSWYNYKKYFGIEEYGENYNAKDRLDRLYKIKELILSIMDKDHAEAISDEFLVRAIEQWIYWNEKGNREGFYEYMREMGYIKEPIPSDEFAWVRLELVNNSNASYSHTLYDIKGSYSPNSFTINWTYIGKTDENHDPDMINGESITFDASFSQPPQVIKANEEIKIKLYLSAGSNSLSYFTPFASARGQIGKKGSGYSDFVNENKVYSFKTDSKNNYATFDEIIMTTAPAGKEGDKLELRFQLYCGIKLQTNYIYEWKEIED